MVVGVVRVEDVEVRGVGFAAARGEGCVVF